MCIRDRLFSLLGAVVGYLLGHYAYEPVSYTHLDVYKRQAHAMQPAIAQELA